MADQHPTPGSPAAVMALYTHEARQVHALCDRCSIPNEHFGAGLSMAQRVSVLVQAYEALREQLGMRVPANS